MSVTIGAQRRTLYSHDSSTNEARFFDMDGDLAYSATLTIEQCNELDKAIGQIERAAINRTLCLAQKSCNEIFFAMLPTDKPDRPS